MEKTKEVSIVLIESDLQDCQRITLPSACFAASALW